ncbi:MAG: protein TolR [Gammaproteobacteria bacterium]|nr:MAG: protein TolR [Gammaproteobacteria bacterium]
MARRGCKRRIMAEMNVVPYIDVMLVLLVIFMITAPLLTQGVKVELPQAAARPLPPDDVEPLEVTVDAQGRLYMNIGEKPEAPVDEATLVNRTAAILRRRPKTPVLVRGDRRVPYGAVVRAMVLLQKAGAPHVGLITEPPEAG